MKKNKLEKLEQNVKNKLSSVSLSFLGQTFYGKSKVSKKDGSYTTTLWYVFVYLPLMPIDSFRVMPGEIPSAIPPKVFAMDDFIGYDTKKVPLDWVEVISTLIVFWVPVMFYILLFTGFPLTMLLVTVGISLGTVGYEMKRKNAAKHPAIPTTAFSTTASAPPKLSFYSKLLKSFSSPKKSVAEPKPANVPSPTPAPPPMTAVIQPPPANISMAEPPRLAMIQPPPMEPVHGETLRSTDFKDLHIWDDLFKTEQEKKELRSKQLAYVQASSKLGDFMIVVGFVDLLVMIAYFFMYAYFQIESTLKSYEIVFYQIQEFLGKGHNLSIAGVVVGVSVFFTNKLLGIILIALAIVLYFGLHVAFVNYLNTY